MGKREKNAYTLCRVDRKESKRQKAKGGRKRGGDLLSLHY